MIFRADAITARYPGAAHPALDGVTLELAPGELVAIAGPNGCGKTTLVRALLGMLAPERGAVTLGGKPIAGWRPAELAQVVALLPQREESPFSWRVEELVGFGRYARRGALSPMTLEDYAAVARALTRCDVGQLRGRRIETLSGGEWQRVRIARALAQEPQILILDEPTASLDLGHEMELFELVRGLVSEGLTALVVTHHLSMAARFADRMLLLDQGRLVASGTPGEVLRAELLSAVFHWPVAIVPLPDGAPQVVPLKSSAEFRDYP